ncbi:hypothetical protein B296_00043883 [Ensete ventricosum]|uniref:Uncharacterized protein n=1 Tax=Ensete ventricosum TaxID=4639 RepID=A0A426Y8Q5_ENSVE|nr:hypothetical protein B296_00043883 [Ensete ventricosum]
MFAVPVLSFRPHRVGSFEESPLSDLEKDLCPSGVERDIGWSRNSLLTSLHPPPQEPRGWAPRGLSPRVLMILTFLRHQSLDDNVLVGPLQHFWYSRGGCSTSDQKRQEGLIPIMKAWMTNDGCTSGMALTSSMLDLGCHFDAGLSSDLVELFLQDKTFAQVVGPQGGPPTIKLVLFRRVKSGISSHTLELLLF